MGCDTNVRMVLVQVKKSAPAKVRCLTDNNGKQGFKVNEGGARYEYVYVVFGCLYGTDG